MTGLRKKDGSGSEWTAQKVDDPMKVVGLLKDCGYKLGRFHQNSG